MILVCNICPNLSVRKFLIIIVTSWTTAEVMGMVWCAFNSFTLIYYYFKIVLLLWSSVYCHKCKYYYCDERFCVCIIMSSVTVAECLPPRKQLHILFTIHANCKQHTVFPIYFCVRFGFTAHQDYFNHFEPGQSF